MSKHIFLLLTVFAALLAPARDKTENWLEVRSPHFIVLSDSNEKQARNVADQFERMRDVFQTVLVHANADPGTPIVVLAVKDKKDFQALEPESYLARGQMELAGLFLRAPDKNYILLRLDAEGEHPYATVYHEYTHLLSSPAEAWLPLWLNEGLAEFYQNTEIRDKDVMFGEGSPENILLLRQERLLPLATLFAVDHNSPYYHEHNKSSIFYAESWAVVHYFMSNERHENAQPLSDYMKLLSQNVDAVTAATRAFGDLKQLQAALDKYVAHATFRYFKMPISAEIDAATFKIQAVTPAQADAVRADFLVYNQRIKDAKPLLERVLRDDPSNASAHETMGYLEFREGNLGEARKWYEQAVKLNSQSFLAYYYFAAITMNGGQLDSDNKSQVENSLRTAIKLNPSFAPAYDQLAVFYGMRRENLDEAHTLVLNAVQLDPGNLHYRLTTANILLQMQRPTDAIAVLQNAASLANTPDEVSSVQNLLEAAQQYQASREQVEQSREAIPRIAATAPQSQSPPQLPPSSTEQKQQSPASNSSKQEATHPDAGKPSGDCARKATAAYGPLEVLTDTKGVDFSPYLQNVLSGVRKSWYNNIPESAKAPLMKKGKVIIEFDVLKAGTISGMKFISTSGDVALDRGAWAGITASSPFSPLPSEFTGQYLGLRFSFYYNPAKAHVEADKAATAGKAAPDAKAAPPAPCVTTEIRMIGEVGIAVLPPSPQVVSGAREQFSALVTGKVNSGVTWKISGAGCSGPACGSISPDGLYTAPTSIPNPPSVIVTATLATAPSETASATVTVVQQPAR
jgi:TonB family protein